jgi:hypothetical protein
MLVGRDDFIEGVGDLAEDARRLPGHADGKVAHPHRLKRAEQFMKLSPRGQRHLPASEL